MKPVRLDQAIVERKLANSRSRAQALIAEGRITLDGQPAQKASQKVHQSSVIELIGDGPDWVGRGALKLLAALEHFNIDPAQKIAADIGASTGGFSEVLLQHDIKRIYAVDVGRDQLHPRVKADPRVLDLSGLNAKDISPQLIPDPLDLIVCDVSFISLKKALPGVLKLCNRSAILLTLIKPQFEAGPQNVGKGGIVKSNDVKKQVIGDIVHWIETLPGWKSLGTIESPIKGADGNQEFLLGARYDA